MLDKHLNEKLEVLESLINFQKVVTEELRQIQLGLNSLYLLSKEWDLSNLSDLNKEVADFITQVNGFIYRHEYVADDFNYLTMIIKLNTFKAKTRVHNVLGYSVDRLMHYLESLEKAIFKYMNATLIKIDNENIRKNANGIKNYLQYVKSASEYAVNVIKNKKVSDYTVKHLIDEFVKIQTELSELVDDFIDNEYIDQLEQLNKLSEIQILTDMYMQIVKMFKLMGMLNVLEYQDIERAKLAINSCFGIIDMTNLILEQYKNT